jgi:hypothetical protein
MDAVELLGESSVDEIVSRSVKADESSVVAINYEAEKMFRAGLMRAYPRMTNKRCQCRCGPCVSMRPSVVVPLLRR